MCCFKPSWFPRVGFGFLLASIGVSHLKNLSEFVELSKGVAANVPVLTTVVGALAYIVPGLMIVGGVLFAVRKYCCIAKACVLASLGGILGWAGLGILLGEAKAAMQFMPSVLNASVMLLTFCAIKRMSCCEQQSACTSTGGGSCGAGSCK